MDTRLTILALSAFAAFTAHAAELESTTPVAAQSNGEAWWNGNCKRIDADIEKMNGRIDVAFAGGSVEYMVVWDKYLEPDDTISKEVMHNYLHLAPKGYDIWAEAISGKVKEVVK